MIKNLSYIVADLRDLFNAVRGIKEDIPSPIKGMTWDIVHERTYAHPYRGLSDKIGHFQIVGVNGRNIEMIENRCWFITLGRDQWPQYYEENFRRARSASHSAGKGSIVPYYRGVLSVDEAYVEKKRNPARMLTFL